jgi:hypothetical protein
VPSFFGGSMTRPIETSRNQTLPFAMDLALRRRFLAEDEPLPGNIRFDLPLETLDKLVEERALEYPWLFDSKGRVVTARRTSRPRQAFPLPSQWHIFAAARLRKHGGKELE